MVQIQSPDESLDPVPFLQLGPRFIMFPYEDPDEVLSEKVVRSTVSALGIKLSAFRQTVVWAAGAPD